MRSKKNPIILYIIAGIILIYILKLSIIYISKEEIKIKIEGKTSIVKNGDNRYLIFTNEEVFENADSFVNFKFDSSDLQNKIKENKKYVVIVEGFRVHFLSMYRNIIKIKKEIE